MQIYFHIWINKTIHWKIYVRHAQWNIRKSYTVARVFLPWKTPTLGKKQQIYLSLLTHRKMLQHLKPHWNILVSQQDDNENLLEQMQPLPRTPMPPNLVYAIPTPCSFLLYGNSYGFVWLSMACKPSQICGMVTGEQCTLSLSLFL